MKTTITHASEAYHFLYVHPKFKLMERIPIDADLIKPGMLVSQDKSGKYYRYFRHARRHALETNLSIFYHKTKRGKIECWLEFGPEMYGYYTSKDGNETWDADTGLQSCHDIDLDCGAPTFDQAIVKLAKLVMKKYGDLGKPPREEDCHTELKNVRGVVFHSKKSGKSPCFDCLEHKSWEKKQGL